MRYWKLLCLPAAAGIVIAAWLVAARSNLNAQQTSTVKIKAADIGGMVSSPNPEISPAIGKRPFFMA